MNIKSGVYRFVLFTALVLLLPNWVYTQPSKSEIKKYIETFVNVGLYAVPYSEPLSVLLSSPDLARGSMLFHVNRKLQSSMIEYEELLDENPTQEELKAAFAKINKYQAIQSCISEARARKK